MSEQRVQGTTPEDADVEGHLLKESIAAGLAAAAIAAPAQAKPVDPGDEAPSVVAAQTLEQTRSPQKKAQAAKKAEQKRSAPNTKKPLPPISD